jgi:hypothetical protein
MGNAGKAGAGVGSLIGQAIGTYYLGGGMAGGGNVDIEEHGWPGPGGGTSSSPSGIPGAGLKPNEQADKREEEEMNAALVQYLMEQIAMNQGYGGGFMEGSPSLGTRGAGPGFGGGFN